MATKAAMRTQVRSALRELSAEAMHQQSVEICRAVTALDKVRRGGEGKKTTTTMIMIMFFFFPRDLWLY